MGSPPRARNYNPGTETGSICDARLGVRNNFKGLADVLEAGVFERHYVDELALRGGAVLRDRIGRLDPSPDGYCRDGWGGHLRNARDGRVPAGEGHGIHDVVGRCVQ
jgi:hypothetical protein